MFTSSAPERRRSLGMRGGELHGDYDRRLWNEPECRQVLALKMEGDCLTSSSVSPWVTTAISSQVATHPDSTSGVMRAWTAGRKDWLLTQLL
jgi:hypothetical protein